jgi:Putative zincin peptidase
MSLKYIDRFRPHTRYIVQAALEADRLRKQDELALLELEQLRPLALLSLRMLIIGGAFFSVLNLFAYYWHMHILPPRITLWGVILWLIINVLGYIFILPVHEAIHGLVFLFWGGKPYFGAKLPLALYCGAKEQLFRRNQYLTVGLAPLLIITLAAIVVTLYFPIIASYALFATIGNFSGAAGDVLVAERLLHLPHNVLVEDTDAGYRAWEIIDQDIAD